MHEAPTRAPYFVDFFPLAFEWWLAAAEGGKRGEIRAVAKPAPSKLLTSRREAHNVAMIYLEPHDFTHLNIRRQLQSTGQISQYVQMVRNRRGRHRPRL